MNADPTAPVKALLQFIETERAFGATNWPVPAKGKIADKAAALAALYEERKGCLACALGTTRTKFVFGAGDPAARLLFVGEAPGFDEDQQGLPFVGAAGQLLTKIIEAMKLTREKVYIANCLKCRPPQNRNPLPEEILACNPILKAQIDIIHPEIVVTLGKFAAQTLLGSDVAITRLRGRFYDWNGVKLMPTLHPAYLLRNPSDKKLVWEDMQKVMKELGIA